MSMVDELWKFRTFEIQEKKTHLCKQSFVVIVLVSISRQMGHVSSLCNDLADTAISVSSVITS